MNLINIIVDFLLLMWYTECRSDHVKINIGISVDQHMIPILHTKEETGNIQTSSLKL